MLGPEVGQAVRARRCADDVVERVDSLTVHGFERPHATVAATICSTCVMSEKQAGGSMACAVRELRPGSQRMRLWRA